MSRLGVVIPAGPRENVEDTVSSILTFGGDHVRVVVVNDSGADLDASLPGLGTNVIVVPAPGEAPGGYGGLWVKIVVGLRALLADYEPDVVLKMDTDALMIKGGLAEVAVPLLETDPRLGILGAVSVRPDGAARDWSPPARRLAAELGVIGLRHRALRTTLRSLTLKAYSSGYVDGEHALGGAYLLSPRFCRWLVGPECGIDHRVFVKSQLGEDHIAGLLCRAAGFTLRDFSGPGDPMAITWRGLPFPPEALLAGNARVVHSIRYYQDRDEEEIRRIFRLARDRALPPGS